MTTPISSADLERLLDNASCASQCRELDRDMITGEEHPTRLAVRMNVADPLLAVIRAQSAELAKRNADAERYRWLRVQRYADIASTWLLPNGMETPAATPEALDAAIDVAKREFCSFCGAGIGPFRRYGEGTCPRCDPEGCAKACEKAARVCEELGLPHDLVRRDVWLGAAECIRNLGPAAPSARAED